MFTLFSMSTVPQEYSRPRSVPFSLLRTYCQDRCCGSDTGRERSDPDPYFKNPDIFTSVLKSRNRVRVVYPRSDLDPVINDGRIRIQCLSWGVASWIL